MGNNQGRYKRLYEPYRTKRGWYVKMKAGCTAGPFKLRKDATEHVVEFFKSLF